MVRDSEKAWAVSREGVGDPEEGAGDWDGIGVARKQAITNVYDFTMVASGVLPGSRREIFSCFVFSAFN